MVQKAAEYLNVLRKRACRNEADFEANMKLTTATEDDVLDEYARELCGEFTRWALLKRHKAFETRLPKYNPRAAVNFSQKNYLRPISYTFLNQIENSAEYRALMFLYNFLLVTKKGGVVRGPPLFFFYIKNLFIFFKLRSFEDFFDLCVPSI